MSKYLELPWSVDDTIEDLKELKEGIQKRLIIQNLHGRGEKDAEEIAFDFDRATITVCTLRQKALHTIGIDDCRHKPYRRHGKKYYRPYRNYFYGNDKELDSLVEAGYMEFIEGEKGKTYYFNRLGLDWLGEQIGVIIHDGID